MKNKVMIQLDRVCGEVDRKIFGHFTEHAFGNIYGGIYDPDSKFADEDGQRKDVLEKLKLVNVPLLRYPGGNFVSNYHWEDGIGPKENRKRVFEYAWYTEEPNQFGTVDFILECRKIGAEPYLCINMGSGTVEEAMHWVEYCNGTGNTYYANLRRSHGYEEPFNVKYWGLGNEIYGDWQMDTMDLQTYGKRAREFGKAMKWIDSSISLVACGLADDCEWNAEAMKSLCGLVDYVSAHHYSVGWGPFERDNYMQNLYVPEYMKNMTEMVKASIIVGTNNNECEVKVAWDEWNLFGWQVDGVDDDASYSLQNALITGLVLNFFIKNCETVGMANYSTFVNINGALGVTPEGIVCRPQFHVFDMIGNNTGKLLVDSVVSCGSYEVTPPAKAYKRPVRKIDSSLLTAGGRKKGNTEEVPFLDAAVTMNEDGEIFISLINKHLEEDLEVEIEFLGESVPEGTADGYIIYHDDVWAGNTKNNPDNVTKCELGEIPAGRVMTFTAKKHSLNLLKMKKA